MKSLCHADGGWVILDRSFIGRNDTTRSCLEEQMKSEQDCGVEAHCTTQTLNLL